MNRSEVFEDHQPNHNKQQLFVHQSIDDSLQLKRIQDRVEEGCLTERLNSPRVCVNSISVNNSNIDFGNISQQHTNSDHYKMNLNSNCLDFGKIQKKRKSSFFQEHQQIQKVGILEQQCQIDDSTSNCIDGSIQRSAIKLNQSNIKSKGLLSPEKSRKKVIDLKHKQVNKDVKFITKIYNRMKNFYYRNTLTGRLHLLQNPKIRDQINDLSDITHKNARSNITKVILDFQDLFIFAAKRLLSKIPRFNPQHSLCIILSILFNFINCSYFMLQSVHLIFQANPPYEQVLETLIYVMWIIQILIKLNSSTYVKTKYVKNREIIITLYFKNNALFDILPYFLLFSPNENEKLRLFFRILQFIKLKNVIAEVKDIQKQLLMVIQNYYFYIQLINLILKLILIAHVISCLWYIVYLIEREYFQDEDLWFNKGVGSDGVWWKQYLNSFYWALTLMSTGSNEAHSVLQMFFTSFILLFTTMTFGYFLNAIGIILSEMEEEDENWRRDVNIINKYMRKRGICKNLQRAINIDLEYYYEKNFKRDEALNNQVLERISQHLTKELKQEYYGKIISKMEYFSKNFSKETMEKLSLCIEECNFQPNQVIFHENDSEDLSLMYLVDGKVQLSRNISKNENSDAILAQVNKNQIFGQVSFFTGNMRTKCAQSLTFSTILKISRDKFLEIIKDNEQDFQQFCFMKDNIMLYQNYESINVKCSVCNKFTHFSSNCSLVHFDKEELYSKFKYYEKLKQSRVKASRRLVKTEGAIKNQKYIQNCSLQYQLNHPSYIALRQTNQTNQSNYSDDPQDNQSNEGFDENNTKSQIEDDEYLKQLQQYDLSTLKNKKVHDKLKQLYQQSSTQIEKNMIINQEDTQTHITKKDKPTTKELVSSNTNDTNVMNQQLNSSPYFLSQQSIKNFNIQMVQSKKEVLHTLLKDIQQMIANEDKTNYQTYLSQKQGQHVQINEDFNIWEMEGCRDYEIYFPDGNSNITIAKYNKRIKKLILKPKYVNKKKSYD